MNSIMFAMQPRPTLLQSVKWIAIWSTAVIVLIVTAFAQGQPPPAPPSFAVLHCDEVANAKIRLRMILVATRAQAEMVLETLRGGQSFGDLARQYRSEERRVGKEGSA